jgi:DNA-binding transcriptional LysR family regulator
VLDEILQERVVCSRNRRNSRGVKRKMSNFPLRRRTNKPLPPIDIAQYWHERHQRDPAHRWLREQILAVCQTILDNPSNA